MKIQALSLCLAAILALTSLLLAAPAHAASCTVTLKADGNTAAVQHAMDRPGPPPVVCLQPGTYRGARLVATRSVTVRGVGKERVILDAGGQGRVLTVPQDGIQVVFEHMTLTNGKMPEGGAVALTRKSRLTLRDCWLTANQATVRGGGAIQATAGWLDLVRSRLSGNTASAATALDLSGSVQVRMIASLISENHVAATVDGPVRLADDARLDMQLSTVAYNSGNGIVLQPLGRGRTSLRIDSSIVMGTPEAIAVGRGEADRVGVLRSVMYGGVGYVALDMATKRTVPGFNLKEAERFRPATGSPAIGLGACAGAEVGLDLAGVRRARACTAGALEAPAADVAETLRQRKLLKAKASSSPW